MLDFKEDSNPKCTCTLFEQNITESVVERVKNSFVGSGHAVQYNTSDTTRPCKFYTIVLFLVDLNEEFNKVSYIIHLK